ncbi:hypothetical protein ASPWEDRAFT_93070, partial [Aspergillus wentii DTO 134E9]
SPKEAEDEAYGQSTKLFEHWSLLGHILNRYEATIRKRWLKKGQEQRRKILLEAWPNIPSSHRPDFRALRRESEEQRQAGTRFEDAFMWPYINQEDLCRGKTLLLLLNARGRNAPSVFIFQDIQSIHVGQSSNAIQEIFLTSHRDMVLEGNSPATYGRVLPEKDREFVNNNSIKKLEGKMMCSSDVLYTLRIQEHLLGFLVACCTIILRDKGPNLTDDMVLTIPELPTLQSDASDAQYRSAAALATEAPYVVPGQVDLVRLRELASARLSAAEDHFWALREDPGYFTDVLGDWTEHSSEMILDDRGKQHRDVTDPPRRHIFLSRALGHMVSNAYEDINLWHVIQNQLDELIKLDRTFINFGYKYEEECPEYLGALRKLKVFLDQRLVGFYLMKLQIQFPASPPIRSLFQRLPNPVDPYLGYSVYPRAGDISDTKDDLLWLFCQFLDHEFLHICGFENVAVELERLIQNDQKQKERITPFLARTFADVGLAGELRNQLGIYRPRIFLKRGNRALAALEENDMEGWGPELIRPSWDLSRVLDESAGKDYIQLGEDGDPTSGKFYYPIGKRRSKETIDAMRNAEKNLDDFWLKFDEQLRDRIDEDSYEYLQRIAPSDRHLQRTGEWIEPEQPRSPPSTMVPETINSISDLHMELEIRTQNTIAPEVPTVVKTKVKTRGIAQPIPEQRPQVDLDQLDTTNQQPRFTLKRRDYNVFLALFYKPESKQQPGEVPWSDFLHAMTCTGFIPEKLYGSVWQFTPTNLDVERSIHFHEPHPYSRIPFRVARRYGRRLNRAYAWDGSMFDLEK